MKCTTRLEAVVQAIKAVNDLQKICDAVGGSQEKVNNLEILAGTLEQLYSVLDAEYMP